MNCDNITNFLKKQLLRCGTRTIDCLFLIKILIYESYKRCKDGRNNKEDWSLSDVNVKQNNVSYHNDKVYEDIVTVGYYYKQKHYRIAQEYNSDNKETIVERFPLYTDEQINQYNSRSKIGKIKITSADYDKEDVTELLKSYTGPLCNFYIDLVDSEKEDDDGIHPEDDGESYDENSALINKIKITGIKAWWILPQMLNNKDKKLVISDQLLNEYEFGPFDIIKFKSSSKKNIFDDILNDINDTNNSTLNIDLSKIDNIFDKENDYNDTNNAEKKEALSSPKLNKRTNIRAFNL